MSRAAFREQLIQELPALLREDPTLRTLVIEMVRPYFADKAETQDRFMQMLNELRQMREESERRWRENERRWQENWKVLKDMMAEIKNLRYRFDSTLGALGARWGLHAEEAFREAMANILRDLRPDLNILRVVEKDEEGEVFGHPDQIELDLIIRNGMLIIAEIKSSMSKGDIIFFERKARFYEKRHGRKADRLIVISPMVEPKALETAHALGIEVFTAPDDAAKALDK